MKNYDNFFLPSNDLKKGKEFYQDILGLSVKFDFSKMGMIAFKVGDNEPAIILKDISKFPEAKPTIWFVVDSVQKEYGRLKAKGLKFLSDPFPIQTGLAVEFEDPFGNKLGLTDYSKNKNSEKLRKNTRIKSDDKTVAVTKHGITRRVHVRPIDESEGFIPGLDSKDLRDESERIN
jgi:predicted enzyme related to lactoylglutathione lyase